MFYSKAEQFVRGRPLSGAGSHGGTSLCIVRDSHSRRVHKRKRINASAAANSAMGVQSSASPEVNDSESDEEPSLPKRNRVNWSSPTRQKMLCSAIDMVQQHQVSVKRAAKLCAIPRSVIQRRIIDGVAVNAHVGPKTALSTTVVYEQWVQHFIARMEKRDEKHTGACCYWMDITRTP